MRRWSIFRQEYQEYQGDALSYQEQQEAYARDVEAGIDADRARRLAKETKFRRVMLFRDLCNLLAEPENQKPLREPSQRLIEKSQSEADTLIAMQKELVHLPRFTCYAKIVKEVAGEQRVLKYKLRPDPLCQVEREAAVLAGMEAYLTARMHDETLGYSRKREQVQQEIAACRADQTHRAKAAHPGRGRRVGEKEYRLFRQDRLAVSSPFPRGNFSRTAFDSRWCSGYRCE